MIIVRRKAKQAQMMVAELSLPMSVENIQLNLKQKINDEPCKSQHVTVCVK
jgi:hypothetical protein